MHSQTYKYESQISNIKGKHNTKVKVRTNIMINTKGHMPVDQEKTAKTALLGLYCLRKQMH